MVARSVVAASTTSTISDSAGTYSARSPSLCIWMNCPMITVVAHDTMPMVIGIATSSRGRILPAANGS